MSGFHRYRLRQLRRAAGLYPVPSFYVTGMRLPGDKESDYIDGRYFSPEAQRWADEVVEYRALGGRLSLDDEECFARVWAAMRSGRSPSDQQQKDFDKDLKWKRAESRIPELYAVEMRNRGFKEYGPDCDLPDEVKGPGSGQELIYRYLYRELGYKNPASAATAHKTWKRDRANGTH